MSELLEQSDLLVKEGTKLLADLGLITLLEHYGEVEVDGSLVYQLMVNPDIDITVYTDVPQLEVVAGIANQFITRHDVRGTYVSNHLDFEGRYPHHPKGVYLGLTVPIGRNKWNLDIWFMPRGAEAVMDGMAQDWYKQLSTGQKETILQLKFELIGSREYSSSIFSADVYRGVVLGGVSAVGALKSWLGKQKHD